MTGLLIKRENLKTNMHTVSPPREDKGRDWADASTSQRMPKTAGKPPEARPRGTEQILSHGPHKEQSRQYFDL